MIDIERFIELGTEIELREQRYLLKKFYPPVLTTYNNEKYYPLADNPKLREFYRAGKYYSHRLYMAGNQLGKTQGAGVEVAYHLTGLYPKDWEGKIITGPNRWWAAGETNKDVKDILQEKLLGPVDNKGTGLIPYHCIDFTSLTETEKADTFIPIIRVKHFDVNGNFDGISTINFKSYEAGRKSFQGLPRNIWLDEEPPQDIYSECLARTTSGDYITIQTFTPLQGWSELLTNFLPRGMQESGPVQSESGATTNKYFVNMSAYDVPFLSPEKIETMRISYHPHVRDARILGIPSLGSGAIYPVPESEYVMNPIQIPKHWKKVFGMDVGWRWTAVVWGAIDPETGTVYLYAEHKRAEATPSEHAEVIRTRGRWIPGVIDSAANQRSQADGESLMNTYTELGLNISNANKSFETGIYLVWQSLQNGQLKIFSTLQNLIKEIQKYQRDEKGRVVKKDDHLCDAMRYLMMSGRDMALTEDVVLNSDVTNPGISPMYQIR